MSQESTGLLNNSNNSHKRTITIIIIFCAFLLVLVISFVISYSQNERLKKLENDNENIALLLRGHESAISQLQEKMQSLYDYNKTISASVEFLKECKSYSNYSIPGLFKTNSLDWMIIYSTIVNLKRNGCMLFINTACAAYVAGYGWTNTAIFIDDKQVGIVGGTVLNSWTPIYTYVMKNQTFGSGFHKLDLRMQHTGGTDFGYTTNCAIDIFTF